MWKARAMRAALASAHESLIFNGMFADERGMRFLAGLLALHDEAFSELARDECVVACSRVVPDDVYAQCLLHVDRWSDALVQQQLRTVVAEHVYDFEDRFREASKAWREQMRVPPVEGRLVEFAGFFFRRLARHEAMRRRMTFADFVAKRIACVDAARMAMADANRAATQRFPVVAAAAADDDEASHVVDDEIRPCDSVSQVGT